MTPIAHIESPLHEKFGIPRQAGMADIPGVVVFEPAYRSVEALRGLDAFDYIWLLWAFHLSGEVWHPTVRPPRLGGNRRLGVFATRSPFRPNPIGLSSVRLLEIEYGTTRGPLLHVSGADLVDGTPIYDIKPYLPYTDSHPEARSGFATKASDRKLQVEDPARCMADWDCKRRSLLFDLLANDPRPRYHDDSRKYTIIFGVNEIHFYVVGDILYIDQLTPCNTSNDTTICKQ